jgi:predicted  nucleic acid-binding Zn-ribbon protein
MAGKSLLKNLKTLVCYDKNNTQIVEELSIVQKSLICIHKEIEQLTQQIEDGKCRSEKNEKNRALCELQAQTLQDDEAHKRDQLYNIKNQTQYKALDKEIAFISAQRKELDNVLLNNYHQIELEKTKIAKDKIINEQKVNLLIEEISVKQKTIKNLEESLAQIKNDRQAIAEQIPSEWQSRYERMKNCVADPIVQTLHDCCSACFYSILHQDMLKLKKSHILPCRNCYRFLYYDEGEQKDAQDASF